MLRLATLAAISAAGGLLVLGCRGDSTSGNLDWGAQSYRKVSPGQRRGNPRENLMFATAVGQDGLGRTGVVREVPVVGSGVPRDAVVSLTRRRNDQAVISFTGFIIKDLEVLPTDISLRDNRGHKFSVRRSHIRPPDDGTLQFLVEPKENLRWMEFNNRDYHLKLKISYKYQGKPSQVVWPQICCVYGSPPHVLPE